MNKRVTIKELATESGESYLAISALVGLLVKRGIAKECGKRANPEGVRGKPSTEFEIPNVVELVLFDDGSETAETTYPTLEETPTEQVADQIVQEIIEENKELAPA